jgi:hypothetical protein
MQFREAGSAAVDQPAAFVAPHGKLSGTIFFARAARTRFSFVKIAGVQARGVPQKYPMHS